ncbi:3795_t:CDS:2, partial [Scutellospora calospora]
LKICYIWSRELRVMDLECITSIRKEMFCLVEISYDKDETRITQLSVLIDETSELSSDGKKLYGEMKFVALRNILKGEELTISYLQDENDLLPLQSRRQKLLNEYYFSCQCCRCVAEEKQGRKKKKNVNRNITLKTFTILQRITRGSEFNLFLISASTNG